MKSITFNNSYKRVQPYEKLEAIDFTHNELFQKHFPRSLATSDEQLYCRVLPIACF